MTPTDDGHRAASGSNLIAGAPSSSSYGLLGMAVLVVGAAGYTGYVLYPRFDLPAAQGWALIVLAAGAGVASFFSPCAFPLLVTLLARGVTGPRDAVDTTAPTTRAALFATALALGAAGFLLLSGAAIALGGAAAFGGVTFTSGTGRALRAVTGIVLVGFGVVQVGMLPNPLRVVAALVRPLRR